MKSKFILLFGAIITVAIVIIMLLLIPVRESEITSELMAKLDKIEKLACSGNSDTATALLNEITNTEVETETPQFLLKLAKINLLVGNKLESRKYTEKAWKAGAKQPETIILLLIASSIRNKEALFGYISRFLDELPDTRANNIFIASVYQDLNHVDKAQKIWLRYFNDKHISAREQTECALRIARSYILQNNIREALKIMQLVKEKGSMNLPAYNMYISLSLINNDKNKAEELFKEAKTQYTSSELELKKGLILIYQGDLKKAEGKLTELQMPSTSSVSTLAANYNARMYLALLRIMESGEKAFFLDLIYNSQESSVYLNGNEGKSKLLKLYISPGVLEAEIAFYKSLSDLFKNKSDSLETFKSKNILFPNHPVVDFIILKAGLPDSNDVSSVAKTSKFLSTGDVALIEGLHGLFIMSPPVIAEISQILYSIGAYKQADKLMASLFNRKSFTGKEINMLLKIAIKNNNSKLLNSLLKLKDIDKFVDFEILQEIRGKPELESKLCKNGIFKVIFLANSGKIPEALNLCDSLKLPPMKANLLKAQIYAAGDNKQEAETLFKQSLNAKNDFWGYREYAKFLILNKKIADAEKLYQKILSKKPHDNAAVIGMVNILEIKGEYDKAIALLNNNIASQNSDFFLKLAKLNIKQNNFPIALRYANKVLRALGKNDEAIFLKTVALVGIYEQYPTDQNKKALVKMSDFLQSLRKKNNHNLIFTAYIESLYSLKMYDSLLSEILHIEDISTNTWLLKKKIISMVYSGKLKLATELLMKYHKNLDENFLTFANAELHAAKKEYTAAMKLLKESKNRRLRYKAAEFAVKAKKTDTAMSIMKTINPSYIDWGGLADVAALEKNRIFAFKCYDEALKLAPDNPLILNNYAWLRAETGELPENKTVSMIKTAYSITPTDGILDTYMFVLGKYHKYEQCKKMIQQQNLLKTMSPKLISRYLEMIKNESDTNEAIVVMNDILQRHDSFWETYPGKKEKIKIDLLNMQIRKMK